MIKSILVPLDGSPLGERAIPLAVSVARLHAARIALVTVQETISPAHTANAPPIDPTFARDQRATAQARLESVAARVRRAAPVRVEPLFLDGPVLPQLEATVRDYQIDLVVMTTHGRGGLSRLWLGSVAEGLMRRVSVPVLITRSRVSLAPSGERAMPFTRVLVALDGSPQAERVIDEVFRLMGTAPFHLTLAHAVFPPPVALIAARDVVNTSQIRGDYLEPLAARVRDAHHTVTTSVVGHTSAARAILGLADSEKSDLLALSTHGRGGVERVLFGSVADKIIRSAKVPLLLLRAAED